MKLRKIDPISKIMLFHQDNAPVHTSTIAMDKIRGFKFELHYNAPYSSDLASSDYFIFQNCKEWLGSIFANNLCVESTADELYSLTINWVSKLLHVVGKK